MASPTTVPGLSEVDAKEGLARMQAATPRHVDLCTCGHDLKQHTGPNAGRACEKCDCMYLEKV